MNGLRRHLAATVRLHARNTMALAYGYLFPLIFLAAFWVLYRYESVPLLRHMGELLTVSVLGGACFGLPTTLVSERERGVWRRYRLTPVPTWTVVVSTAVARYVIVLSAGLLQLAVALAVGMTAPAHPLGLWAAFTLVAFAFIGLGLVIAALADTVPAVQALGQCIFLPMLIIGGVAVRLESLPEWAQHLSAFFPGRYAVEALQSCVNGGGLGAVRFPLLALAVIGGAGILAGGKLFRWDGQQRFLASGGKAWLIAVLAAWAAIGFSAETRGRVITKPASPPPADAAVTPPPPVVASTPPPPVVAKPPEPPWMTITDKDVAALDFRMPPDHGVVSPIAPIDEEPDEFVRDQVEGVRTKLLAWPPASEPDEVQCVRNLLYVCAVPDAIQMPVERYLPRVVLQHLTDSYPKEKLIKLLTWIVLHPEEGRVIDDISDLGIPGGAGDPMLVRERVYIYATKFIERLSGRKPE
ncbi:MAG: ABC transporter permease [Verrucomicrobia bacterium]|nr:ABC transporter permease [Verrucomicrobiota bacterium]